MNYLSIIAIFSVATTCLSKADAPDFSKMSDEQLIDSLQAIKDETVSIDSLALADAFLAEDKPPKFAGGVIGTRQPVVYPEMRVLVQRGLKSLPALLRHLDDPRPTQLSVPRSPIIMWSEMAEEYSPRFPAPDKGKTFVPNLDRPEAKLPYTVKVGDVCFALIGQILGRPLMPVRYQPTGGMIINSPVSSKKLAEEVRKDWTGLTDDAFRDQLIEDAATDNPFDFRRTLPRLRYYFPDEYARQKTGSLKENIAWFEKDEKGG